MTPDRHRGNGPDGAWLRQRVSELEHELAVLRVAHAAAEQAARRHAMVLAAASHDLRQPLHALHLLLGVLTTRLDQTAHAPLLRRSLAALAAGEALLGGVWDLAALDTDLLRPAPRDLTVGAVLEQVGAAAGPVAAARGLRLRIRPCASWIRSDPVMLLRILGNLVGNAIRYTPAGGVLVGCRRRGQNLRIEVWDSGIGIARERQAAIFDPFYRIAPAPADGHGLGLAIAARLAHALGHGLTVASWPGRGSVFAVTVPLAAASQPTN